MEGSTRRSPRSQHPAGQDTGLTGVSTASGEGHSHAELQKAEVGCVTGV